jgi:alkylation response protein AidB-like acyl-CoA dehydrogenase
MREGGQPLIEDRGFRERVAELLIDIKALEITQLRVVAGQGRRRGEPDPASSILKIRGSELLQSVLELIADAGGPASMAVWDEAGQAPGRDEPGLAPGWDEPALAPGWDESALAPGWAGYLAPPYLFARSASIYGGSTEIQKNIIAKTLLGL